MISADVEPHSPPPPLVAFNNERVSTLKRQEQVQQGREKALMVRSSYLMKFTRGFWIEGRRGQVQNNP